MYSGYLPLSVIRIANVTHGLWPVFHFVCSIFCDTKVLKSNIQIVSLYL